MKTIKFTAAFLLASILSSCFLLLGSPRPANDIPLAFHGEIMDSVCARLGTHEDVMRDKGITDQKECVSQCLRDGGHLVLQSPENGLTYALDANGSIVNQDRLLEFAGGPVKIVGSLDENANRIWHIQSVQRL